jgi:hypothetical protein
MSVPIIERWLIRQHQHIHSQWLLSRVWFKKILAAAYLSFFQQILVHALWSCWGWHLFRRLTRPEHAGWYPAYSVYGCRWWTTARMQWPYWKPQLTNIRRSFTSMTCHAPLQEVFARVHNTILAYDGGYSKIFCLNHWTPHFEGPIDPRGCLPEERHLLAKFYPQKIDH